MAKYSVIIPVYNSTESLKSLHSQLSNFFETRKMEYEVLFINDGSQNPETYSTLFDLFQKRDSVKVITLRKNFGQHAATLCGMAIAKGDFIITMDDDLQHNPDDIERLLKYKDHDLVIAAFPEKKHGFKQKLLGKIKNFLDEKLVGKPTNIQLSSFRLFKKGIADSILSIHTPFPYFPSLMLLVTADIKNVSIPHSERAEGHSGYSWKKIFQLTFNLLFNNSTVLLRTMAAGGFLTAFICLLIMLYFLFKKLVHGIEVEGWTSLLVIISGSSGLILGALGVLGEYMIRLLAGIEKRPPYFIKDIKEHAS